MTQQLITVRPLCRLMISVLETLRRQNQRHSICLVRSLGKFSKIKGKLATLTNSTTNYAWLMSWPCIHPRNRYVFKGGKRESGACSGSPLGDRAAGGLRGVHEAAGEKVGEVPPSSRRGNLRVGCGDGFACVSGRKALTIYEVLLVSNRHRISRWTQA
jgi:hypothetical protein